MDAIRNNRKETVDQRTALNRMEEKLDRVLEYSMSAAQRVTATEYVTKDADFLGLKWHNMQQIQDCLDDPEKRGAIARLLQSNMVTKSMSSYVGDVTKYFFSSELHGRLYNGIPKG